MKKLVQYTMFSLLGLSLGLMGCKENNSDSEGKEPAGKPASISLSLKMPSTVTTRATTDIFATEDEAKLVTADVFIYEPPVGILVNHYTLTLADFTQVGGSDVYTTTDKLATTTGQKIILVGLNLPTAVSSYLAARQLSAAAAVHDISIEEVTSAANGFAMFSTTETDASFVADENDPANSVRVEVKRLSSKITLQKSAALDVKITEVDGGGTSTLEPTLEFVARNSNREIFYLQPADLQDPNWSIGSWAAGKFEQGGEDVGAPGYIAVNESNVVDPLLLNPQYAIENTSEQHLEKETTYASVRGQFIPGAVWRFTNNTDATGGFTLNTAHGITTPQTFYLLYGTPLNERYYFFDLDVANAFEASGPNPVHPGVITYTSGYCYWNMFLNPDGLPGAPARSFDVLRNAYYKATITSITAPGNPTPSPANPDQPVQVPTNISVTVDILYWDEVPNDYELKP